MLGERQLCRKLETGPFFAHVGAIWMLLGRHRFTRPRAGSKIAGPRFVLV